MNIDHPDPSVYDAMKRLWGESFGDTTEQIDLFFNTAFSPKRALVLKQHETVQSALYWLDCEYRGSPVAYLYAVATAPAFRGQGCFRRLMKHTHRVLASSGYAGAILVPAGESLVGLYGALGYMRCCPMQTVTVDAGAEPAALHPVSQEEYAALRRKYLPVDGVRQEGASLRYLAGFASLYVGADFLLAAVKDESELYVPELLGNQRSAPGIVAALGEKSGRFHLSGGEDWAMYLPLYPSETTVPGYFGLAFD